MPARGPRRDPAVLALLPTLAVLPLALALPRRGLAPEPPAAQAARAPAVELVERDGSWLARRLASFQAEVEGAPWTEARRAALPPEDPARSSRTSCVATAPGSDHPLRPSAGRMLELEPSAGSGAVAEREHPVGRLRIRGGDEWCVQLGGDRWFVDPCEAPFCAVGREPKPARLDLRESALVGGTCRANDPPRCAPATGPARPSSPPRRAPRLCAACRCAAANAWVSTASRSACRRAASPRSTRRTTPSRASASR